MFTISYAATGETYEFFSFAEVAEEIGCTTALLESAIAETPTRRGGRPMTVNEIRQLAGARTPQMIAGFQALRLEDYKRLAVAGHVTNEAPELPGFPGHVLYDDAAREFADSGAAFIDLLRQLHISTPSIRCLSREGRDYALENLKWLAEESMPAGVKGAVAAGAWRQERRQHIEGH